jgi:uncharacterized phosphosugar-binding protein
MGKYYKKMVPLLNKVFSSQAKHISAAAKLVATTIKKDGLVYVFGSGHSHMIIEELFYRAGGLANVQPIFIEPLMLHDGAITSTKLEAKPNYVNSYLKKHNIKSNDLLLVVSNSGRNSTNIDVALWARKAKAKVIVITSLAYTHSDKPTHPSKKYLYNFGDVVIDNNVPIGDSILSNPLLKTKFAPASTAINIMIIQSIVSEAIELSLKNKVIPHVFLSGNLKGGKEHNHKIIEKYSKRVPPLK